MMRFAAYLPAFALILAHAAVIAGTNDQARETYQMNCSVCHGDAGDGASHARQGLDPPPRDFTSSEYARSASVASIAAFIRLGKPGTAMIAWENVLSEAQIEGLAAYVYREFVQGAPETLPVAQSGATMYQENCSVCHGDRGRGAIWGQQTLSSPPRDFGSEASRRELTRDRMIASVSFGRPGTPMPGFASQLDTAQIEQIVDHIRSTFMSDSSATGVQSQSQQHAGTSLVASGTYHELPLPNGLSGDSQRGNAYYLANCVACHGHSGNGDGPRAYFIYPRPRNFLDPATRQILNRPTLFNGIKKGVVGKEMPAWGKVLTDQDIADISEYVYQTFIRGDSLEATGGDQ